MWLQIIQRPKKKNYIPFFVSLVHPSASGTDAPCSEKTLRKSLTCSNTQIETYGRATTNYKQVCFELQPLQVSNHHYPQM